MPFIGIIRRILFLRYDPFEVNLAGFMEQSDTLAINEALEAAGMADAEKKAGESLVPYHLRHSALTRLAENCPNPYALAAAAGHSSITMTYRYVHPQKREIWAAFAAKSGHRIGHSSRVAKFQVLKSDEVENG